MGRTLQLVLFLILMAAPVVLSGTAGLAIRNIRYSRPAQTIARTTLKFVGQVVKDILKDLLSPGHQGSDDGGKLDDDSADVADLFIFNLSVGSSTPPQDVPGILDITSQLVWSQCSPCTACMPAPAPTFEPNKSGTFSGLPCRSETCQHVVNQTCAAANVGDACHYVATYGEATNTTGYLANDTFTFGSAQVPGFVFGCSGASMGDFFGASGVFGFSRGPLSLVSQLQLTWFSYFWASDSGGSCVEFGDDNVTWTTNSSSSRRSTPLLTNRLYPDLYFVNLTGIKVDGVLLTDIPAGTFDLRANGSGGVFVTTTVPATLLEEAAYNVVRDILARNINAQAVNGSALGLDLCYKAKPKVPRIPGLALVFHGSEAVMNLKSSNYFFHDNDTGLYCLTMLPYRGVSLLGSLLQKDRNMTYDIANNQLVFDAVAVGAAQVAASPPLHSLACLVMVLMLAVCVSPF